LLRVTESFVQSWRATAFLPEISMVRGRVEEIIPVNISECAGGIYTILLIGRQWQQSQGRFKSVGLWHHSFANFTNAIYHLGIFIMTIEIISTVLHQTGVC
jgi:hypothetical protein